MNIVLACDFKCHNYLETTINSIISNTPSGTFYLINTDFPSSWFNTMSDKLQSFNWNIVDKKIEDSCFKTFATYPHITIATFYRYLIPNILDVDKVLYLDADLIATNDLTTLYNINMEDYPVVAVKDCISEVRKEYAFNAGVLLIDVAKWKANCVFEKALAIHHDKTITLRDADQSVLNIIFKNQWLEIDDYYNFQTAEAEYSVRHRTPARLPLIVHYTTQYKPWTNNVTGNIFRRIYRFITKKITFDELIKNQHHVKFADYWFKYQSVEKRNKDAK